MNNKLLLPTLLLAGAVAAGSVVPAQAYNGWGLGSNTASNSGLNSGVLGSIGSGLFHHQNGASQLGSSGLSGTGLGSGVLGSVGSGLLHHQFSGAGLGSSNLGSTGMGTGVLGSVGNGLFHHQYNGPALGSNSWGNSGLNNGMLSSAGTGFFHRHHRWENPNSAYGNTYNNNNLSNNGYYNGYNRYNNSNGYLGNNFGGGQLAGNPRLMNEQYRLQQMLNSGTLSPQQQANVANRLAGIQAQEAGGSGMYGGNGMLGGSGMLGSNLASRQSYLQNLLSSGNLSAGQAASVQNQLARMQNGQTNLASGAFSPNAGGGFRRMFGL